MVFTRFIVAYGSIYVRIVANCIALMLIGFSLLYVGYDYLGNRLVVTSFLKPIPEFSTSKPIDYQLGTFIPHGSPIELARFSARRSGYVKLRIEHTLGSAYTVGSINPTSLTIEILMDKNDVKSRLKKLITGFKEEYVSLGKITLDTYPGESYDLYIRIPDSGSYVIIASTPFTDSSLKPVFKYHTVLVEYHEDQDIVVAKWFQLSGFLITGMGVLFLLLSPLVASFYARALHKHS